MKRQCRRCNRRFATNDDHVSSLHNNNMMACGQRLRQCMMCPVATLTDNCNMESSLPSRASYFAHT
jgi:hypothetical protein